MGLAHRSDRLGNLIVTLDGDPELPSVMVFAHMDQMGFVVRKVEPTGLIRLERLGGVPERALPAQAVVLSTDAGDVPGVIGIKSHHATLPEEKYRVVPYAELSVDAGFSSKAEAEAAGIEVGTPVTYLPRALELAGGRIAGTAIDDRAGCAALLALAAARSDKRGPTLHLVWSVQEEHNLRGVLPAATALAPDIAIQVDLVLACDTPEMASRGDVALGAGPAISLYSFHGRGTLNGVIPHPALVDLVEDAAAAAAIPLQRSAHVGALTDLATSSSWARGRGLPRHRRAGPLLAPGHRGRRPGRHRGPRPPPRRDARPHRPGPRPHPGALTHTLGVDIGTFESKGVLVTADGEVVASATRPHRMLVPQPGWAEHRPDEDWWADLVAITRELLRRRARSAGIDAVATSAIGPCMLPVDEDGRPLMNAVLYGVDTRASAQIAALNARIGEDRILERCGNALTSQSVGPKILWLKETHPDLYARTARGPDVHELPRPEADRRDRHRPLHRGELLAAVRRRVARLDGRARAGHPAARAAAAAGLVDRDRGQRDGRSREGDGPRRGHAGRGRDRRCGRGGRERRRPRARRDDAHVRLDDLHHRAHRAPGPRPTAVVRTVAHPRPPRLDGGARDLGHAHPLVPRRAGAGRRRSRSSSRPPRRSPKGAKGLLCLPYFSGERTPIHDPDAKGAFFGLDLTHTRGDLFRAVLEGIASGTAHVMETYRELGIEPRAVQAVGGGTQNAVWVQATSDLAGSPRRCASGRSARATGTRSWPRSRSVRRHPETSTRGTPSRGP